MHQKPFSGWALPEPGGGTYSTPIDPGFGEEFGLPGTGEEWKREKEKGWEEEKERFIALEPSMDRP